MIGSRIKSRRKQLKITQKELGATLGKGESTISEWESEKRSPDAKMLHAIATALSTTVSYLTGEEIPRGFVEAYDGDLAEAHRAFEAAEWSAIADGTTSALTPTDQQLFNAFHNAEPLWQQVALDILLAHPSHQ